MLAGYEDADASGNIAHHHDFGFHRAIAAATGNQRFVQVLKSLEYDVSHAVNVMRQLVHIEPWKRTRAAIDEHRQIYRLIREQDAEGRAQHHALAHRKARSRMLNSGPERRRRRDAQCYEKLCGFTCPETSIGMDREIPGLAGGSRTPPASPTDGVAPCNPRTNPAPARWTPTAASPGSAPRRRTRRPPLPPPAQPALARPWRTWLLLSWAICTLASPTFAFVVVLLCIDARSDNPYFWWSLPHRRRRQCRRDPAHHYRHGRRGYADRAALARQHAATAQATAGALFLAAGAASGLLPELAAMLLGTRDAGPAALGGIALAMGFGVASHVHAGALHAWLAFREPAAAMPAPASAR